jgi:hypothetical protein
LPVAMRKTVNCGQCGTNSEIVIQPTAVRADISEPFVSPATGRIVSSRVQLHDDLRRSGCHLREPGESKDLARTRQEIAAREDQNLEHALRTTAQGLGL